MEELSPLPPIKNKAVVSLIKMGFNYYQSMTGVFISIFVNLLKCVIQFSVLFVSSHEEIASKIRIYLIIVLMTNVLSLLVGFQRFIGSYQNARGIINIETFGCIYYDAFIGIISITEVLIISLQLNDVGPSIKHPNLMYSTLSYSILYEQFAFMFSAFFSIFFIIIYSSMNRNKTSFLLKLEDHDKAKYTSCAICLENYQNDEFVMVLFCDHNFHYECVSIWLEINNFCPICKNDLDIPITLYENKALQL